MKHSGQSDAQFELGVEAMRKEALRRIKSWVESRSTSEDALNLLQAVAGDIQLARVPRD